MIIYLDESKKLARWDFIYWWFISKHNSWYLTTFVNKEQEKIWINLNLELKSTNNFWKEFVKKVSESLFYEDLEIKTFWFHFKNYYVDSFDNYKEVLIWTIKNIYPLLENYYWNIKIIPDRTSFKDYRKTKIKLENIINNTFKFKRKVVLEFENSSTNKPLQLADLIVWKYKELYLFDDIISLDNFVNFNKLDFINFNKWNYIKINE